MVIDGDILNDCNKIRCIESGRDTERWFDSIKGCFRGNSYDEQYDQSGSGD